jgi:hypothetical protein
MKLDWSRRGTGDGMCARGIDYAGASLQSAGGNIILEANLRSITGTINAGSGTFYQEGAFDDTNFTSSTTQHSTYIRVDLPVVNVYSTEVIVSLPGKPNVDLTFAKPFSDPAVQTATAPRQVQGAAWPSVLAFVGKGQKLAWGTSDAKTGVLKLYDQGSAGATQ